MARLNDLFQLTSFSALVFQHTVILLLLTGSCTGQSQEVAAAQTVVALVGDDVVLPCYLEPALDVLSMSLEWGRPDLEPRFVHVWHEGQNLVVNQNPSYKGRTSLSKEKLKRGDLSLNLSAVKLSDNGRYRCYFPSQSKESMVELIVGSVSSPVIAGIHVNSSGVALQCRSGDWYPEPEVSWLDSEGHVLSAGPPETVRGPDGLYTVSSRVTVEKRHGNRFTCRVHQKATNQTRETQIQVSADYFEATSSSSAAARVSITVVLVLIFSLSAAFVLWKWRRNQMTGMKKDPEAASADAEGEQLVAGGRKMEDLEEKKAKLEEELQRREEDQKNFEQKDLEEKKAKLEEELRRREEDQEDFEQEIQKLMEQRKELKNQRDELRQQEENEEKTLSDIENQLKSVEKMPESERYEEMRSIAVTARTQLRERKQEKQKLQNQTDKLLNKTDGLLDKMTERKKEAEEQKEKTNQQLEEIQRKLQKLET